MELPIEKHFSETKNLNILINTSKNSAFENISDLDEDQYDSMIDHSDEDHWKAYTAAHRLVQDANTFIPAKYSSVMNSNTRTQNLQDNTYNTHMDANSSLFDCKPI